MDQFAFLTWIELNIWHDYYGSIWSKSSPSKPEVHFPESRLTFQDQTHPELNDVSSKERPDFIKGTQGYTAMLGCSQCVILCSQMPGSHSSIPNHSEEGFSKGPSAQTCVFPPPQSPCLGAAPQIWPPSPPLPLNSGVHSLGLLLAGRSAMGD